MEPKRLVFVVGHEDWGKSRTLRALIDVCHGQGKRINIDGTELFVRMMSNDDKPKPYHEFMRSLSKPYVIAALCPKFRSLRNYDDSAKAVDSTFEILQQHGYKFYFWVIEHKWQEEEMVITREELSELRRYGTVEVFERRGVESIQRARQLRSYVSNVVLA